MPTRPGGLYQSSRLDATQPLDVPSALVGRVIEGRYQLERLISSGGMGFVFEATQLSVNRRVAVKLLKPELAGEIDLMQRFAQEVEAIATLSHPHIVTLNDAGRDQGGLAYLLMEFVRGETFRQSLQQGALSLVDLLGVFAQVCEALHLAHEHGVIHRDLKFDNIMITRRPGGAVHAQVLDFGVAKMLRRDLNLTRGGQLPGTPGIIAPELADQSAPSPQSDLYSIGVLLYTVLCGSPPFQGPNDLALMHAHQFEALPRLEARVHPYVPEEVLRIVYQLLEKSPADRPADALMVRDRIEEVIAGMPRRADHHTRPYVPPAFMGGPIERLEHEDADTDIDESIVEPVLAQHEERTSLLGPILVPSSVVVMLALLLLALIVVLITLLTRTVGS